MKWSAPYSRQELSLVEPHLTTERLNLRPITTDDWSLIWEMESDPDVMRYIVPPYSDPVAHREEFLRDIKKGERYKFFYVLEQKVTGRPVGWVLLRPTENGKWVELGYRLIKRAWGQGLVPEATNHIIQTAFKNWGLEEVVAVLMPENSKSARVAEKLGMVYEGITREFYGIDMALYRIKAADQGR